MGYLILVATLAILALAWANNDESNDYNIKHKKQIEAAFKKKSEKDKDSSDGVVFEETEGDKQKRSSQMIRRERSILPENFALKINLVSFHSPDGGRYKRATYNSTSGTWPHVIPYKFDEDYPADLRQKLQSVMQEIMDNVCIVWIEVPDFDPENNTYPTNAYLRIVSGSTSICSAVLGRGSSDSGARNLKPCTQFYSMAHELLHTLGVVHEQQGPLASAHLVIHGANVKSGYFGGTYKAHDDPSKVITKAFDASSIMMYSRRSFSSNGLDVMIPYTEDEFLLNGESKSNMANVYEELNEVYKCKDLCVTQDVDCGLGYYTRIKDVCKCVCPDGFDSASQCTKMDDETTGPQDWPEVRFGLYAASETDGVADCPNGFSPAQFNITGNGNPRFYFEAFFRSGKTGIFQTCARETNIPIYSMSSLPMGEYCLIKHKFQGCDSGFEEGGYLVKSSTAFGYSGNYGDWEINGDTVTMKYCCRSDKPDDYHHLELPRTVPFRMISRKGSCTLIKGMRTKLARFLMFVSDPAVYGAYPLMWKKSYYLVHNFCTYRPAEYGCNIQVDFDRTTALSSVDVSTPGFEEHVRFNNKRCLYYFNIPEGGRMRVTINTLDVGSGDEFNIRHFNKWSRPYLNYDGARQFLTEGNFFFAEWWSASSTNSNRGVSFTVDAMFDEDNCYDVANRGSDYVGDKSVSEKFEECIPWSKAAAECDDFPWDGISPFELLSSGRKCRNPLGKMAGPWCYVSIDKGMCKRAYCDVCNKLEGLNRDDCADLIFADPDFCTQALQRTQCTIECPNIEINPAPPSLTATCSAPTLPQDGIAAEPLKAEYTEGERVSFRCASRPMGETVDVQCQPDGNWPTVNYVCTPCPYGSIPHEERCITYDPTQKFIEEADAHCAAQGGRIFEIKSSEDWDLIRYIKSITSEASGASWVNAKFSLTAQDWMLYDDQENPILYTNWSPYSDASGLTDQCVVMIWEKDLFYPGEFTTASCNLAVSRTFCELPRIEVASCEDRSSKCLTTIANDPDFCRRAESYEVAIQYCPKSCGECESEYGQCSAPYGFGYHRSSSNSIVEVGEVMEFACNEGYYLVSGSLRRACGADGQFVGEEPYCTYYPTPKDIGASSVMFKRNDLPLNQIFLLDLYEYRMPYSSYITHWHYYAITTGDVHFVVYRELFNGTMQLVGSNQLNISETFQRWTHAVSFENQIAVQEGDVIGVFSTQGKIAAIDCTSSTYTEKLMELRIETTTGLLTTAEFTATECWMPSVGCRIA